VRQTSENGFILSCVSFPDLQNRKAYIIKTDFGGNIIWQKLYGDGITDLVIFELQPLNGGYVITGFKEVGTLSSDLLLMKLNLNGDTLWTRIFGGNDVDIGYSVIPTPFNSGYLIAGYTRSFSVNGKLESYIVKTDSNGILQWQRSYSNLGWEGAFSVRYKPGLGYAFAGYSDSLNNNVYNAKLRAIDLLGNLLLETSFHPGIDDAGFNSLELTTDGGFILGGNEESSLGGSHIYVVKTDSLGFANPIGIESIGSAIPVNFKLHQNYPNPFNPLTTIKFDIPSAGTVPRTVRLVIYDMLGREIAVLVNENLKPGSYEVKWDASNFASGMYFYKLKNGGFTQTKKMVLIK
jgi:hypothetical protein